MKQQILSHRDIAAVTAPLSLMLHAGIPVGDALTLLAEDEQNETLRALFTEMGQNADYGASIARVMEDTGRFPAYVTALLEVGERTGRTEEALNALSANYEQRERTERRIRSALTYPLILLVLMLVVIVVLLSQVLPVFEEVYASLGGQLTGVAGGLLVLGQWLDSAMPVLCVLLAAILGFAALFSLHGVFRAKILSLWHSKRGDKGIARKMNDARFAQALAMGLASGLPLEEAAELSASLLKDVPDAQKRFDNCRTLLESGTPLSQALHEADMLPRSACRLLEVSLRSGSGDATMSDIASSLAEEADLALEELVAKVEPSLVLITSLLVGAILLSVMLPLMNIMSAIG